MQSHRFTRYQLIHDFVLGVFFIALFVADARAIVNNVTWSLPYVWVFGTALIVGTCIWALAGLPTKRIEVRGTMGIGRFFTRVTMNSPEGKVVLWGSIANLCLACALLVAGNRVPNAAWIAGSAAVWPFLLFLTHAQSFMYGRLESRWFRIVLLVGLASIPSAKVLNDLSVT